MSINVKFQQNYAAKTGIAVIYIYEGGKLSPEALELDKQSGGFIKNAIKNSEKFEGKCCEFLTVPLPDLSEFSHALCVGVGKLGELDLLKAETLGGKAFAAVQATGLAKAVLFASDLGLKKLDSAEFTAHFAAGFRLRSYKFETYKTVQKNKKPVKELVVVGDISKAAAKLYKAQDNTIEGVFLARDVTNEPPNVLYPDAYAKRIKKELTPLGVKVEILDEKKMKTLGMGGIIAVGQGSAKKPRMVIMHWNGVTKTKSKKATKGPFALVGKGVTFDTGGISIKPSAGMDQMKMDMGGSAAVVGAMKALALNKVKADVVAIVGLAENMPSDNAYRPGDIIKSYGGKTIEVLNTDAEGRLVLIDCLAYVQKKYKPKAIIDLATLTGAMMVALGTEYCGTFANDDTLWSNLEKSGKETGEKIWRMPLDPAWKKEMESQVADLQNLGDGRFAGACTAAGFLEHFIEDGVAWAHMDIAGTAWIKKDLPTVPKFGTGFGVRLLENLIAEYYT